MKFSQKIGHLFEEFRTLKRVDVREHILKNHMGLGWVISMTKKIERCLKIDL